MGMQAHLIEMGVLDAMAELWRNRPFAVQKLEQLLKVHPEQAQARKELEALGP